MPLALTATATPDGDVILDATGCATYPATLDSVTDAGLEAGVSVGADTNLDNADFGDGPLGVATFTRATTDHGTLHRTKTGSPTGLMRVTAAVRARTGGAKVRAFLTGLGAGDWVDVDDQWRIVQYGSAGASTSSQQYGLELHPLSPYQAALSVDVRTWRLWENLDEVPAPYIERSDGVTITLSAEQAHTARTTGAFTAVDRTAPLGVALTYTLFDAPPWLDTPTDTLTVDHDGPILSAPDTVEDPVVGVMVLTYSATVTPSGGTARAVGAAAPVLSSDAGSLRSGSVGVFFADYDSAQAAHALAAAGRRLTIRQSRFTGLDMTFAVERATLDLAPGADPDRDRWLVTISYAELDPAAGLPTDVVYLDGGTP